MAKDVERWVCGFQESYLFSFDLNSISLTLLFNYPAGAFLIDYDLEGSDYYFDGSLFI